MNCRLLSRAVLGMCAALALGPGAKAAEGQAPLAVPVSINALMVTMIDHSAHHVWNHEALERDLTDEEWRLVEYFSVQLAAAGPLIALGGSGPQDATWAASPQWREMAQAMSGAALVAMDAAKARDKELLSSAATTLVITCQSCHDAFKPASPTEGIVHQPDYDHLYHLFVPE